ncbi:MAG: radical SAM protein [Clostridia bacterium]
MKKFKKVYVEITNVCNLSCNFCPKTSRIAKFMSVENFLYIAKEVKKHSDYIYLHVKGEPLFHKNLAEILQICEDLSLKVCLTTNATLLKEQKELLLSSNSIHKLHISLHSFEASDINLTLEDYLQNIVDLIEKSTFITVLRLWNDGGMDDLNENICKMLKNSLNLDFDILKNMEKNIKIRQKCYVEFGEKFSWANINGEVINESGFCYGLRDQIAILVDGTVVPCCLDNDGVINLGNIYKNSLEDIYLSELSQNIVSNFSNRKLYHKLCTTCGFIRRF